MHLYASARHGVFIVASVASLSACAPGGAPGPDGIYDPYEAQNRKVHAFNRGLDRALVRPAGRGYSTVVPEDIQTGVGNFAQNLDRPSNVVNAVLQGDLRARRCLYGALSDKFDAGDRAAVRCGERIQHRRGMKRTLAKPLHVWGAGEGAYLELPFIGPTTQRDAAGLLVDFVTNPLRYTLDAPEENYSTVASLASRLGDRGRFTDTVDSILYESADSYAQLRLVYLQNRRFELGDETAAAESEIDPFDLDTEGF